MRRGIRRIWPSLVAVAGVVAVWWLLSATGAVSPANLPSPATVAWTIEPGLMFLMEEESCSSNSAVVMPPRAV